MSDDLIEIAGGARVAPGTTNADWKVVGFDGGNGPKDLAANRFRLFLRHTQANLWVTVDVLRADAALYPIAQVVALPAEAMDVFRAEVARLDAMTTAGQGDNLAGTPTSTPC